MRWRLMTLALLLGLCSVGSAQEAPTTPVGLSNRVFWSAGSRPISAIALTQIAAAANPLGAGWLHLALAGESMSIGTDTVLANNNFDVTNGPLVLYGTVGPTIDAIYTQPNAIVNPPSGTMPGASPVAGSPEGLPLLSLNVTPATSEELGKVAFTIKEADGSIRGGASLSIPTDGWWEFNLSEAGGELKVVAPPTASIPQTPVVPEPGTMALAGLGLLAVAGYRRLRS